MTQDEIELFLQKANKLEKSSFWTWLRTPKGQPDMQKIINGDWLAHAKLSEESLDSFCLTLRLLIQDRDGFSIRDVRKEAMTWSEPYHDLRDHISEATDLLHKELSRDALVNFTEHSKTSKSEVFDIIFYGGLTHSDKRKREQFRKVTESGLFSYFVFQSFSGTLFYYRNCIMKLAFHLLEYVDRHKMNRQ